MTDQHRRIIKNLILRGCTACHVCHNDIDNTDELRIILLDNTAPRRMANLGLRHAACQISKYRPGGDTHLVELMIASPFKLCVVCKKSWVGYELEALTVGCVGTVKHVLHRVCL